jgi:hypothetical protein
MRFSQTLRRVVCLTTWWTCRRVERSMHCCSGCRRQNLSRERSRGGRTSRSLNFSKERVRNMALIPAWKVGLLGRAVQEFELDFLPRRVHFSQTLRRVVCLTAWWTRRRVGRLTHCCSGCRRQNLSRERRRRGITCERQNLRRERGRGCSACKRQNLSRRGVGAGVLASGRT